MPVIRLNTEDIDILFSMVLIQTFFFKILVGTNIDFD